MAGMYVTSTSSGSQTGLGVHTQGCDWYIKLHYHGDRLSAAEGAANALAMEWKSTLLCICSRNVRSSNKK